MVAAQIATLEWGVHRSKKEEVEISTSSVTVAEAASLLNVSPASVKNARKVLQDGTAEEIVAAKAGTLAVGTLAKDIRKGVPPEERGENRPKKALAVSALMSHPGR